MWWFGCRKKLVRWRTDSDWVNSNTRECFIRWSIELHVSNFDENLKSSYDNHCDEFDMASNDDYCYEENAATKFCNNYIHHYKNFLSSYENKFEWWLY